MLTLGGRAYPDTFSFLVMRIEIDVPELLCMTLGYVFSILFGS